MITYNHEKFIAQAIQSALDQVTDFDYELVIGEDFSTDKTREICIAFKEKFPDKIRLLLPDKNLGATQNFIHTYQNCRGSYLALLEGDDYWIDKNKLQMQVDFLDSNPDFSICATNAWIVNELDNTKSEYLGGNPREVSDLKDLLRYGSAGATCTLLVRLSVLETLPQFIGDFKGGDWLLQIMATTKGKLRYFRNITAVYRKNTSGVATPVSVSHEISIFESYGLNVISMLKKYFKHKYDNLLDAHAAEYWHFYLMELYQINHEINKARNSAFQVIRNFYRLNDGWTKAKKALRIVYWSYRIDLNA